MKKTINISFILLAILFSNISYAQNHSVARQWNEVLLEAIRNDFARPTIHARNLFHVSASMYDAWSAFDETAIPYLFNRYLKTGYYEADFSHFIAIENKNDARKIAISYATYRMMRHRFSFSPGRQSIYLAIDELMESLGYDTNITSTDYSDGSPAKLGNFIAQTYISHGLDDGSNEDSDYINLYYKPVNPPLVPIESGNELILDLNRWQPLFFDEFIDQSGNSIPSGVVEFLSPEWGNVIPFAIPPKNKTIHERDEDKYIVYHDPGDPPYLDSENEISSGQYQWGFSLVSIWGAHLGDDRLIDISPANFGNNTHLPSSFDEYDKFYNYIEGGDIGSGRNLNPFTNAPYEPNLVKMSDYSRVLAEFWADGPDSETPPGHWFTILNYVMDHSLFERKFEGVGSELDEMEYEVKAYFILGGTMHDAAISAWGAKGYYDYIRPISAIRALAELGQSSDVTKSNFNSLGIPLVEGYIETVESGDPLAGNNSENIGKIKLFTWRGHDFIDDPATDVAGVGWILAENWWPYQRPTFVTPPFAGYVSGHSTFSRAAAEVMTLLTGDPYFPGGIGEFVAKKNEFLVFEEGPSEDVTLQWATYRDASDQTSLSRIWGGIHPPADDIPGRMMGIEIGINAFAYAKNFFEGITPLSHSPQSKSLLIYPNPISQSNNSVFIETDKQEVLMIYNLRGEIVLKVNLKMGVNAISTNELKNGVYFCKTLNEPNQYKLIIAK